MEIKGLIHRGGEVIGIEVLFHIGVKILERKCHVYKGDEV